MKKKVYLTRHSKVRYDERTDIHDGQEANAQVAFNKGLEFSNFIDPVKSFLNEKSGSDGRYVAKIYEGNVYVFENRLGHRLLTVYKVPEEYLPIDKYLLKSEDMGEAVIVLTDKETDEYFFWNEDEPTDSILDALIFNNQVKAANYLKNNRELQELMDNYNIEVEVI